MGLVGKTFASSQKKTKREKREKFDAQQPEAPIGELDIGLKGK